MTRSGSASLSEGKAHSQEERTWASQDLSGYTGDAQLPEYRKIEAAIALEGTTAGGIIRNQRIPPSSLPGFVQDKISETFEARMSIDEIESSARRGNERGEPVNFSLPMGADIARLMTAQAGQPFQQILSL